MTDTRIPADVASEYFGRVSAGRADVVELFAPDAQLVGLGTIVSGAVAIGEFYSAILENASPTPEFVGEFLVDGGRVAAQIWVNVEGAEPIPVVDMFEISDGRIDRLTYFVADTGPSRSTDGTA